MFPLPTSVGLRYGRSMFWREAFLGGLGADDFRERNVRSLHVSCTGNRDLPRFRTSAHRPILSIRWAHLPYRVPPLLITNISGAGISDLLAIAYDYDVLGLGPDSPWDD